MLNTHTLLWYINGADDLSERVASLLNTTSDDVFVSAASLWEVTIKSAIGKLPLGGLLPGFFELVDKTGFSRLAISDVHLLQLSQLPFHHRDPFDRLLIAQALAEDLIFISKDAVKEYPVKLLW